MPSQDALLHTIDGEIKDEGEALIDLCRRLVAAPSASPPGRTVEVARIVEDFLNDGGIQTEVVAEDPDAPNVVAHIGDGPGRQVVFNAHMDTMQPGDESKWTVPILRLTQAEGRLYGLGMGNMKGALAAMCLASVVLARHRSSFDGRLTMTAVCDEVMFGERGAAYLLKTRPDVRGDYLISGEGPGFMQLAPAEKGLLWLDIECQGDGGHSSRAQRGQTAAAKLASLLARIDLVNDMYAKIPAEIDGISGGEGNTGLRVSLNIGAVESGGVRSLIATRASAQVDVRLPPGIGSAEIERRVRSEFGADPAISVKLVKAWDANWTSLSNPLVAELAAATVAVRGQQPQFVVRLPGSDARRWRELGVPAACYGPQPTLSAGVDDYANEQDVLDCARIYARAALRLLGS